VRVRASLLAVLTSLGAAIAVAQQFPTVARGVTPNKQYSFGDIDTINSYNGNLSIAIPIGLQYPVNGSFKYGLVLHYNSKVWDYEKRTYIGQDYTSVVPNRDSNAGLGWLLDFGRVASPHDSSNPLPDDSWSYLSPDGSRHGVGSMGGLHPGSNPAALSGNVTSVGYSHEGQYFRMLTKSDGSQEIDSPDGIARTFDSSTGNLSTMSDPYGNTLTLTKFYTTSQTPCPSSDASAWAITDSQNRTHYICFANTPYSYTESAYDNQWVERVILAGPQGQPATYQFYYAFLPIAKGCGGNYPYDVSPYPNLPMLSTLRLPDGSTYSFTYNQNAVNGCDQGTLASVTLPTQATINYTYREYMNPVDPCPDGQSSPHVPRTFSDVVGVGQKTITGPNIPAGMTWTWTSELSNSTLWVQCLTQGGPYEYYVHAHAPSDQMMVRLTNPDQSTIEHYYSVWPGAEELFTQNADGSFTSVAFGYPLPSENGALINEFGLPFTRLTASGTRFLSTRRYDTNATLLRTEYVRYEYDDNTSCFQSAHKLISGCVDSDQRLSSTQTVYHDDGGRTAETDQSDFDGFGHYRRIATNGGFPGTNVRTSYTDYNSGADALGNVGTTFPFSSSAKWVTTNYGDQWVSENSHTSKAENCFDGNGFLNKRRLLLGDAADANSIAEDPHDVLILYGNDGHGNVAGEQYFGGDTCGTSTLISGCASAPTCAPTGVPICNALDSGGVPAYDIHHGYSYGVQASSQYYQCNDVTALNFKSIDRDIDASGLVRHERDSALVQTEYDYDSSGRVTRISPAGESAITYTYPNASLFGSAFTPATMKGVRGTMESDYQYDALGRLWREKQLMPDNSWSLRETTYDASGRVQTVSAFETIPDPSNEFAFHPVHKSQLTYDVFERPLTVQALDGNTTSYTYIGASSSTETVSMSTPSGPSTPVTTMKVFDRQGRMISFTEGYSTPLQQTTSYGYDVGNRLSAVSMGAQSRSFVFDNRGFLTSETHPENGTTTYQNYDARGHAGLKLLPGQTQFDLRYNFDSAERVWLLEGRNPYSPSQFRTLKQFTFGQANNGSDLVNGKLQTALRKNYDPSLGTATVSETFQYGDSAGRLTTKTTNISGDAMPTQSLTQSYTYNDLGEVATTTYPKCTGSVRCGQSTWSSPTTPDVAETYTDGLLSSVSAPNSFRPSLGSLSYAPNGMVQSIVHSNGVTDTQTPDTSGLPRPQSISVSGWASCAPPSISSGPDDKNLPPNNTGTSLVVSATGTGTLHYLWQGPAGAISNDSATLNTGPIAQTSYYSVKVTDDCGVAQSRTAVVTICDSPTATVSGSTTIAPGGSATIQAALTGTAPWSITWSDGLTLSGLTSSPASRTVTPAATATYTVTSIRDNYCSGTSSGAATVTVSCTAPTATVSGGASILPGGSANVQVALTGTAPWTLTWSDGLTTPNINSSPYTRSVSPASTTTYSVTSVRDAYCNGTSSGSATVVVSLGSPGNFSATTAQNNPLSVLVQWSAVSGAQWYQVERAAIVSGAYSPVSARLTTTSFTDSFGATSPTAYLYRVRAGATVSNVDTISNPSALDYATVASVLFTQEPLVAGQMRISGIHVGQLRQAIDAVRRAAGLQPAWTSYAAATGLVAASDNTAMRQKLDEAVVLLVGHGVVYSGVVPAWNGLIYAYQWQQIRDGVR